MEEINDFIPHRFIHNENGIVVTNAQGQVLWVNPAFSILCGYSLDELKGKKPGTLVQGPESDPEAVQNMREAIRAGVSCVVDLTNYHKDGHSYPVHIRIMPVEHKDGKIRFFAAIERTFTEKELKEIGRETLQAALHGMLQDLVTRLKQTP